MSSAVAPVSRWYLHGSGSGYFKWDLGLDDTAPDRDVSKWSLKLKLKLG